MEINEIEATLKSVNEGDYSARVDETRAGPELKPLAQTVNKTIEKFAKDCCNETAGRRHDAG